MTITHTPTAELETMVEQMLTGAMSDEEIIKVFQSFPSESLTAEQLASAARAMRRAMVGVRLDGDPLDTCGTGGSGKKTINTSTIVAFIVAAAGGKVAKHGNRSASGNCGCFDVLEALGARIDLTPEEERAVYDELGIVFLFARSHHPALKNVAAARKLFSKKTFFNLLGPLCNPASANRQMIGTGNLRDAELLRDALQLLGTDRSLIVTGMDGLDEVSVCAPTVLYSLPDDQTSKFVPADLSLPVYASGEIDGGSVDQNVQIVRELAQGRGAPAHRDLVLANAAHALLLTPLVDDLHSALILARETLESGAVAKLIDQYVLLTNHS